MPGYYVRCPHCGNESEGDYVRRCNECGQIYCDRCGGAECPSCGASYIRATQVGTIRPND